MNGLIVSNGAKFTETGLTLNRNTAFEQWEDIIFQLARMEKATQWWIGDALNFGEQVYGEMYASAISPSQARTWRQYKWVANAIELSRRRDNVDWSTHVEIASLEPCEQDKLLDVAEELNLSTIAMRAEVKKYRTMLLVAKAESAGMEAKEYNGFKVNDVYVGDVHKIELPENSIDMIFTDPPYHDEHLELYQALADFAFHSLKPGAYLMTYAGKMFLPEVMRQLGEKLEYVWMYGVFQPDSNTKIIRHHLFGAWRPIVCYKKPGKTNTKAWQPDMIKGTRDKSFHEWQQQIEPPIKYIGAYTLPGELVVDPFVGGGTTLAACKMLGRDYLGFDKDAKAVKITKMRLNETSV